MQTSLLGFVACGLLLGSVLTYTNCARHPVAQLTAAVPLESSRVRAEALSALLGVNEGLSVPSALVRSRRVSLPQQAAELAQDGAGVVALGARSVRANCHTYPYLSYHAYRRDPALSLRMADAFIAAVDGAGLEAVMVLGPWPCIQTANYTDRYLAFDMDGYADFVRAVVERYDGDGDGDMPGLSRRVVVGWEVDNEPDLHNSVQPRGAKREIDPSRFETPEEYAAIVRATSAAIKSADPEAVVVLGGMYNARSPSGRRYLDAVLAAPGVLEAAGVISLHCYSDDDSLDAIERTIAVAAEVAPEKPLWITEVGVSSEGRHRWQSEAWQAKMVAAVYGASLVGGVERVYWHTLADPPTQPGRRSLPFDHHSLYRTITPSWEAADGQVVREQKPAGAVYARLSVLLAEVSEAQVVARSGPHGKAAQLDEALLVYWGSMTLPAGAWRVTDLLTGAEHTAEGGAALAAPAWATPHPVQ